MMVGSVSGPDDVSGVGGIISKCDNAAIDELRWKEFDPSGGDPSIQFVTAR
jgi:hypothetical protein